jgi:hypothetical protein
VIECRAATVDEEAVGSTAPIDEGVIMAMDEKLEEGRWWAGIAVRQNLRESHLDGELSLAGTHLGRGLYALIRRGAPVAIASSPGYVSVNEIRATRTGFPSLLPCIRNRSDADAHAS